MKPNADPPRSWLTRPAIVASALLLTVAVTVVLAHEGHAPLPSKGARVDVAKGRIILSADARAALDVQTTEIGTTPPPDTVLAYATLVAPWKQHAFVVSRLPGRIVALHARPGDEVKVGQVVAEVQSQELESLRLEVLSARTEATLAEQVYAGIKESAGAIPEGNILTAEVQRQQTRNSLELAKVKWLALGLPQDVLEALVAGTATGAAPTLPIRSPVAGTVIHADLAVGKGVEPGEHLFEVIDLSTVWAKVGVLEKDITRVAPGRAVEVRLTAYPGEAFRGTVSIVGQSLDPTTHLNDVWVEFRNPVFSIVDLRLKIDKQESTNGLQSSIDDRQSKMLLPGMSGLARIELPAPAGTKSVPQTALVDDGVDRFVLVEEASASGVSEYRKKSVVVVRDTPDLAEIRSPDLFPGDRVVTRGGHELGTFFAPRVLRLTPESARTIGLKVEPVTPHPVETVVELPGAVDLPPDRRSVATTRLPGTITAIRVDRSQQVKAGEVLAEVFSLELLNLQLDLLREHLAADLAGQQVVRLREAKESVPKRRLVEAEAAATSAANRRDSLRRRLLILGIADCRLPIENLQSSIDNRQSTIPVRATAAGTVVSFDRVVGQSVRADEPLFEVHDLTRPWVQGFVSEKELGSVRVGQSARVRLIGNPGIALEGKVARSSRTFGATDRTLSVWVELNGDPPIPLRHNQMARLSLVVEGHPPTLAIPLGAICREGTQAFVFVQSGDTFVRRAVALGRADDRFAEVERGLTAGEPVAVAGVAEVNTAWASLR